LKERIRDLEQELAAQQSPQLLSSIDLQNYAPAIVFQSGSLQIVEANQAAIDFYGLSLERLRSSTVLDLCPGLSGIDEMQVRAELRKPVNIIGPLAQKHADGRDIVVRLILLPSCTPTDSYQVAIIQDETRLQSAEDALRSSEERYRELFENANDVILLHDLTGRLVALNRAAESLFGYSRRELIGQRLDALLAPGARTQLQDNIRTHLGGSATQHYEVRVLPKSGASRYLEVSTRLLYRDGHPAGVQAIGRDITERKLAQVRLEESAQELQNKNEELTSALRLAQEATQLKEQFLANTSHELRTPMNGIMGMIDLLRTTDLTPEQDEYAGVVNQCATDLLTIINDLLDMSQIEAGKMAWSIDDVHLQESVDSVVKLLRVRAQAKELALNYQMDPSLPASLRGDSVRFRQILTNLLGNAIKFTATGSVNVTLKLTDDQERVRCEVRDTGIGVEESVRERIFEAFFQADGTNRRRFGGTGLGLAICKLLVEAMGGQIGTYNNQSAPGATFWFELPRTQGQADAAAAN
jgi:two-component system, sensor histidine kinase and response regulator